MVRVLWGFAMGFLSHSLRNLYGTSIRGLAIAVAIHSFDGRDLEIAPTVDAISDSAEYRCNSPGFQTVIMRLSRHDFGLDDYPKETYNAIDFATKTGLRGRKKTSSIRN